MNTKYLKIVLLISILVLAVRSDIAPPTQASYWSEIAGTVTPHISTYNRATNTYIVSHAGPNGVEIAAFNVFDGKPVFLHRSIYVVIRQLQSHPTNNRVAMINHDGEVHVISSSNNWNTFKTHYSSRDYPGDGTYMRLKWKDDSNKLYVGLTNGTACLVTIEDRKRGRNDICRKVNAGGWFYTIEPKARTDQVYFLEGATSDKVVLVDFMEPMNLNTTLKLRYGAVNGLLLSDRVDNDYFYVVHNTDFLYAYYQYENTCEMHGIIKLGIEAVVQLGQFRNTKLLLVGTLNTLVLIESDGIEEVGRIKYKSPGFADWQTWSFGESDGYLSVFQRAVESQGRWWNWQVSVIQSTFSKANRPVTLSTNSVNSAAKTGRRLSLLRHILNKKSAKNAK